MVTVAPCAASRNGVQPLLVAGTEVVVSVVLNTETIAAIPGSMPCATTPDEIEIHKAATDAAISQPGRKNTLCIGFTCILGGVIGRRDAEGLSRLIVDQEIRSAGRYLTSIVGCASGSNRPSSRSRQ